MQDKFKHFHSLVIDVENPGPTCSLGHELYSFVVTINLYPSA